MEPGGGASLCLSVIQEGAAQSPRACWPLTALFLFIWACAPKSSDLYTFRPFLAPCKSAPGFSSSKVVIKVCSFLKCFWGLQGASENPAGEHYWLGTVYNFWEKKKVKDTFRGILFW